MGILDYYISYLVSQWGSTIKLPSVHTITCRYDDPDKILVCKTPTTTQPNPNNMDFDRVLKCNRRKYTIVPSTVNISSNSDTTTTHVTTTCTTSLRRSTSHAQLVSYKTYCLATLCQASRGTPIEISFAICLMAVL